VRTCVIFNPTARGEKAKRFRRHLDEIGAQSTLKLTTGAGHARQLAAEAVGEGFEIVVAAGGDGTVNEVLNGLGDAAEGFDRARLGVLPLGTVNVFARELGIPLRIEAAWSIIRQGHESRIDLPSVQYSEASTNSGAAEDVGGANGSHSTPPVDGLRPPARPKRYFVQLAGAGLDARAIELVKWELKKKLGPLAYVLAGLNALCGTPAVITAADGKQSGTGGLVLIGNGRLYGGQFRVFPQADLRDGLLDVCIFPRANWSTLARSGPYLLVRGCLPASIVETFRASSFTLSSPGPVPLEVDGELIGHLPATFTVEPSRLRVIVP
jgi:YegS/Rv2252/BmrU family lipid kinase